MKANKTIYGLSALALLSLASCGSDFLGTPTDSRVEIDTTDKMRMLLVSSYPSSNYAWPCELMSDNMEDNNAPDANGLRYNLSPYDKGDEEMFRWEVCVNNTSSDSPSQIWESHYNAIAGANAVLEGLEKMEAQGELDDTQKAIKGEALLIRSYCHFIIAQCFCHPYRGEAASVQFMGIPYIKKPETTVKPHYERGTLAETYQNIRQDLEEGLPLISDNLYEVPKYHFNKQAAHAFAARFYLFTREYRKCLDHCNEVFGGDNAEVSDFMSNYFRYLADFYTLADHGLYQQSIERERNFLLIPTYSVVLRRLGSGCRFGVTKDALNATIHSSGPTWSSFSGWGDGKGHSFAMHPCFIGCAGDNGKYEYGQWYCGNIVEQFEYSDKLAGIGYCHTTRSEFTGEELILTRAEAKLFLGDMAGAISDLSVWEKARRDCYYVNEKNEGNRFKDLTVASIREFYVQSDPGYGIAKTIHIDEICPSVDGISVGEGTDEMGVLQCIQHFRRIETLHNGMRWFDLKRLGLEFDRKIGKNETDHLGVFDERKAMQIPAEIQAAGIVPNKQVTAGEIQLPPMPDYILPPEKK